MSAWRGNSQRDAPAHEASGRVPDDVLVRWLHEELDEPTAQALEEHVAGCPDCHARTRILREKSRRVGRALRKADFAGPAASEWERVLEQVRAKTTHPRPARPRRLLVAGMVLAILGTASLAGSAAARGWVAEQWSRIAGTGMDRSPPAASTGPDQGAQETGRADLAFKAMGPGLDIVLEQSQAAGTLTLRFGDEAQATVSVSGGGQERLVVGGGGVRIRNASDSDASYRVALPLDVERASVRIGDLEPVELTRSGTGSGPVAVDLVAGGLVRGGAVRHDY